jgi:hypothetical protein
MEVNVLGDFIDFGSLRRSRWNRAKQELGLCRKGSGMQCWTPETHADLPRTCSSDSPNLVGSKSVGGIVRQSGLGSPAFFNDWGLSDWLM